MDDEQPQDDPQIAKSLDAPMTVDQILSYDDAMERFYQLYCVLQDSLYSIMEHAEAEQKLPLLRQTVEEFSAQVAAVIPAMEKRNSDQAEQIEMCLASLKKARSSRSIERHLGVLKHLIEPHEKESLPSENPVEPLTEGAVAMPDVDVTELQKRLEQAEAQLVQAAALEKRAQDAEAKLAAAEELAKAEVEKRLEQEYITKAKGLTSLTIDPTTDWKVLRAVDTLPEDVAKRIREILASANEMVSKGGLFAAKGYDGRRDASASPTDEVQQLAEGKIAAGVAKNIGDATQKVFVERPDLYDAYRREVAIKSN